MITRIKSFFANISGIVFFALALINFFLAVKTNSIANRSCVITNVIETVSSSFSVTNSVSDFSSFKQFLPPSSDLSPTFSSSSPTSTCEVARWPYRYFICNRRIGLEFMGRFFYEGSPCSYGRISQIYPDRVLLVSGDWITNVYLNDKESFKNERR